MRLENSMRCEHNNLEYIPQEIDVNIYEDVICLDCGISLINTIDREEL